MAARKFLFDETSDTEVEDSVLSLSIISRRSTVRVTSVTHTESSTAGAVPNYSQAETQEPSCYAYFEYSQSNHCEGETEADYCEGETEADYSGPGSNLELGSLPQTEALLGPSQLTLNNLPTVTQGLYSQFDLSNEELTFSTDDEELPHLHSLNEVNVHRKAQTVITPGNNAFSFSFVYTGDSLVCDGELQGETMTQTIITGKVCGDKFTD
ncbi:uncharacterized protein LOC128553302 [Mercenaria mercenaria]|uniref:uncharacterized protein LOC128553302 n=1 Tax=Mercenaria mercenaria TaxID=6596 RepID=UPI00234F9F0C|nr:uncharacterized protein LOC128553302 [Mercenaria mercenaria]